MYENKPLVSVVMPVYNAELYIEEAIESILGQTFEDWELIIVDDASSDGSLGVIKRFLAEDDRIKLIELPNNIGGLQARNRGLSVSSGKYYAVQDADDISMPERLERQVRVLEANPNLVIVGSNIQIMDEKGRVYAVRHYPESVEAVKKSAMLFNPFAASAAMVRTDILLGLGGYPSNKQKIAEDYSLWLKILSEYDGVNIPQFLMKYRLFQSDVKNTVRQKLINNIRAKRTWIFHEKYFSVRALGRFVLENMMILLPQSFVLWLFKKCVFKSIA